MSSEAHMLTWWEFEELIEHLEGRPDIWTQSDENPFLWMRCAQTWSTGEVLETPACALYFLPPANAESPYRMFQMQRMTMSAWSDDEVLAYVEQLLQHWTSYGHRTALTKFL